MKALQQVLKAIGRKLRKNGPSENVWYAFGAAAGAVFVANSILPSNWSLPGGITPGEVGDVIGGGLVAAGIYELQLHLVPRLLAKFRK